MPRIDQTDWHDAAERIDIELEDGPRLKAIRQRDVELADLVIAGALSLDDAELAAEGRYRRTCVLNRMRRAKRAAASPAR